MNIPSRGLAHRMRRAAEMRIAGLTLAQIGDKLGVTDEAVGKWRRRYGDYWQHVLAEVRADQLATSGDEALGTLRMLLRSKNEKTRHDAARQLRAECDAADPPAPPAPKSELHQIADYIESLSHDQRTQLLDRELARRTGPAAHAPGRPDGRTGA